MASFRLWSSIIGLICLQSSVHAQHLRVRNISYIQPFDSPAQSDWYYMSDTLTHDAVVAVITKNQKRLDLFSLTDSRNFQETLFQGSGSMMMYRVKPRDDKSFVILTQTCVMQFDFYPELKHWKRFGPCTELANAPRLRYNNLANLLAGVTRTPKFKELAVDVATRAVYFSLNDNAENIYHCADGSKVVTKLNKASGRLFDVHNRVLYTVTALSGVNMFNRRTDSIQTLVDTSDAQSVDSGGYLRSIKLRKIEAIHYYRNGILFVRDTDFIHCLDTGIKYGHQIKFFTTKDTETPKTKTPRSQISGSGQSTRSLLAVSNSSRHIAVNGKGTAGYSITIEPIRKLSVKYDNASTISWSYDDPNSLLKVIIECPKPCPNRKDKDEKRITNKGTGEQLDVYEEFGLKPTWNYTFVVTGVSSSSDYEITPAKISEAYVSGLKVTGVRHNGNSLVIYRLESQDEERRQDKFIVCLAGRCAGQKNIDRGPYRPYDCNGECGSGENAVDLLHSGELKDGETVTIRVGITGNSGSTVFTPPITVTIKGRVIITRNSVDLSIIDLYDLTLSYIYDRLNYRPSYVKIATVNGNLDQTFKLSTASTIRIELTLDKNADGYYLFLPQKKPTIDISFLNSAMEPVEIVRFTEASPSYQLRGKMRNSGWYTKDYVYQRRGILNVGNNKLPVYLLIMLIVAPVFIVAGIVVFILWKKGVIVPAHRRKNKGGRGGKGDASSSKRSKSKRKGKNAKIHIVEDPYPILK